jgi:hypothetical protein
MKLKACRNMLGFRKNEDAIHYGTIRTKWQEMMPILGQAQRSSRSLPSVAFSDQRQWKWQHQREFHAKFQMLIRK